MTLRMSILSRCVSNQRQQPKLLQSGNSRRLKNDRLEWLESIGFVCDPHDDDWNMRFKQLKEYRAKHRNCMVPQKYAENEQSGAVSNL